MSVLVLGSRDIARIVERVGVHTLMDLMIDRLHRTLLDASTGRFDLRARAGFTHHSPSPGVLEWMPVMQDESLATIKVVAYNPANTATQQLPTVLATTSLYDVRTGRLLALVDGVFATALRTGAASAVASRILAHPDSSVLGMVGCGMQAVTQVHALTRVRPIRQVLAYDRDPEVARTFAERIAFLGLNVRVVSREELERSADVLCTATSVDVGHGPVIAGGELRPHVHVNAVGSDLPGKVELPLELLRRSRVCPDFMAQAVVEGECQQLTESEIGPDLVQITRRAAEVAAWRHEPTVFDSTGMALEDHAAILLLIELAKQHGAGMWVELEHHPDDPRNPYAFAAPVEEEPRISMPGARPPLRVAL